MSKADEGVFDQPSFDPMAYQILSEEADLLPDLTRSGRYYFKSWLNKTIDTRKRVDSYAESPNCLSKRIVSPIFIIGMPRTGTTYLHKLLAEQGTLRYLMNWEADHPVPPALHGNRETDPRCVAKQSEISRLSRKFPQLAKAHYEDAISPTECDGIFMHDLKSMIIALSMGSREYLNYLFESSHYKSYIYHQKILQILQDGANDRWILKMPSHSLHLKDLLSVYPDARFIWIHRDPHAVVASFSNLIYQMQTIFKTVPDLNFIRSTILWQLIRHLRGITDVLDGGRGGNILSISYKLLISDPQYILKNLNLWLSGKDVDFSGISPASISNNSAYQNVHNLAKTEIDTGLIDKEFGWYLNDFKSYLK